MTIPVSLRLFKDGKLFSEEKIETIGSLREYTFYRKERDIHTLVRNIKITELPTGSYSAEITVLKDIPEFDHASIYANVIYYTPENLARVDKESRAIEKKMDSYWFNGWLITKFWVEGFWCVKFCAAPLHLHKSLDVEHAGQTTTLDFNILEDENYEFVLLLDKGNVYEETERRIELFGDNFGKGTPVVISLRVIKDRRVYYETTTRTMSFNSSYGVYDEEGKFKAYVAERVVKYLELKSGHYSAIFTVLNDNPDLTGIAAFAGVNYSKIQGKYIL